MFVQSSWHRYELLVHWCQRLAAAQLSDQRLVGRLVGIPTCAPIYIFTVASFWGLFKPLVATAALASVYLSLNVQATFLKKSAAIIIKISQFF